MVSPADVHLLLATIPPRRASAERLLGALPGQSLVPGRVHLRLDGYGDAPAPVRPDGLDVVEHRTPKPSGPGGRWLLVRDIPPDAVVVVLDDDQVLLGPRVIETLAEAVAPGGAAAHGGTAPNGFGGALPKGRDLICMGAAALAIRAGDIAGLEGTLAEVREKCGFDPFGDCGDDEAVVALHLWRRGVPMRSSGPLEITTYSGARASSQFQRRQATKGSRHLFWQREAIRKAFGWPWVTVG